jgi:hypothetical protein
MRYRYWIIGVVTALALLCCAYLQYARVAARRAAAATESSRAVFGAPLRGTWVLDVYDVQFEGSSVVLYLPGTPNRNYLYTVEADRTITGDRGELWRLSGRDGKDYEVQAWVTPAGGPGQLDRLELYCPDASCPLRALTGSDRNIWLARLPR